jgi:hypothetical protein
MTPTYLYIKQHSITGLKYLGKTTKKDPNKYNGSGKYWTPHRNKHGVEHIETLWYCLFTEEDELVKFALMVSALWDIVNSTEWANLITENGKDGCPKGINRPPPSIESNIKRSIALKGRKNGPLSYDHRENIRIAKTGKKLGPQTDEHKTKRILAMIGKKHTPERIEKMRISKTGKKLPLQSQESNKKRSISMQGRTHSLEHIENYIKSRTGKKMRPQTPEHIAKRLASRQRNKILKENQ